MKIKRLLVPAAITLTFSVISVVKAQESSSEPAGTVTSGALGNVPAKAQELPLKFAVMDTDKDGKISKDELVVFAQKKAKERAEKRFKEREVNGDGFMTADELRRPKQNEKKAKNEEGAEKEGDLF